MAGQWDSTISGPLVVKVSYHEVWLLFAVSCYQNAQDAGNHVSWQRVKSVSSALTVPQRAEVAAVEGVAWQLLRHLIDDAGDADGQILPTLANAPPGPASPGGQIYHRCIPLG